MHHTRNMNKKLTSKDFINIGIFSILLIVVVSLAFSITFTPIIQFARLPVSAFLGAPVFLLFVAKTQKPFVVTIMGVFCSVLLGFLMFGSPVYALVCFVPFLIAEIILYIGKYKNLKLAELAYVFCSLWPFGAYGIWWYDTEHCIVLSLSGGYAQEFVDGILEFITPTSCAIVLFVTAVFAVLGILFTRGLFKKHFKKAGLIA